VFVYYTSVDRNSLLHCFGLLRICCTTCFYSCAAVDKISTDIARRAVRLMYHLANRSIGDVLSSADISVQGRDGLRRLNDYDYNDDNDDDDDNLSN